MVSALVIVFIKYLRGSLNLTAIRAKTSNIFLYSGNAKKVEAAAKMLNKKASAPEHFLA